MSSEQRVATEEDWQALLDKPCNSMWTDWGQPMCSKQFACFIFGKDMDCPEGRKINKDKAKKRGIYFDNNKARAELV